MLYFIGSPFPPAAGFSTFFVSAVFFGAPFWPAFSAAARLSKSIRYLSFWFSDSFAPSAGSWPTNSGVSWPRSMSPRRRSIRATFASLGFKICSKNLFRLFLGVFFCKIKEFFFVKSKVFYSANKRCFFVKLKRFFIPKNNKKKR